MRRCHRRLPTSGKTRVRKNYEIGKPRVQNFSNHVFFCSPVNSSKRTTAAAGCSKTSSSRLTGLVTSVNNSSKTPRLSYTKNSFFQRKISILKKASISPFRVPKFRIRISPFFCDIKIQTLHRNPEVTSKIPERKTEFPKIRRIRD